VDVVRGQVGPVAARVLLVAQVDVLGGDVAGGPGRIVPGLDDRARPGIAADQVAQRLAGKFAHASSVGAASVVKRQLTLPLPETPTAMATGWVRSMPASLTGTCPFCAWVCCWYCFSARGRAPSST